MNRLPAESAVGDVGAALTPRRVATSIVVLAAGAWLELAVQSARSGVLPISARWQILLGAGGIVVAVLGIALLVRARWPATVIVWLREMLGRLGRTTGAAWIALALGITAYPIAVFGPTGRYLEALIPRLFLFWLSVLAIAWLLRRRAGAVREEILVLGCGIGYALLLRVLVFVPDVSAYPFTLGWSEASRYYYASLFHARSIYGMSLAPPELHPTRYLLQSIPFLGGPLPLWFHRLWQVALWLLLPTLTAIGLLRRLGVSGRWPRLLLGGWVILFLFQGPVYYHLLVMVVVILFGVDSRRPARSTAVVVAASLWAGISRVNWYPVPAILAGCLYLIEIAPSDARGWKALRWPIVWGLTGLAAAMVAQAGYVRLSGMGIERFTSSLSSALLLYRLLPNPTYGLGMLPAILVASAPIGVGLVRRRREWSARLDGARFVFVGGSLGVLGLGGLVVSLKIGGGSNLHNFDAYLVLLLLVGSGLILGGARGARGGFIERIPGVRLAALAAVVPIAFAVEVGGAWVGRETGAAASALTQIRAQAQAMADAGRPVLFISQRHLLTFGLVPGVPLEPEYETVFLMEMAMSGTRPYLDRFHAQLRDRAFGLIVVERLSTRLQGSSRSFGEENDAWVREVSIPVLCSYRTLVRLDRPPVDLMVPQGGGGECPQ